jgi:hypothetical protein
MGFFKAERELVKQAKEIQKSAPPMKDRMANVQNRMSNAMEAMAAQTAAANMALTIGATGIPASITVTSVAQTGTVNFDVMLKLEATVMPDGQPPYPATIPLTISQMQAAFIQPGKTFSGKIDPGNRTTVWIDPASIR